MHHLNVNLCRKCCEIDFDRILTTHALGLKSEQGYKICSLDYIKPQSGCLLCTFFFEMRQDRSMMDPKLLELRAYSANRCLLGVKDLQEVILLAVASYEYRYWAKVQRSFSLSSQDRANPPDCISVRDTSGEIDWEVIKKWITFCQEHHTQLCSQTARASALTVIDCKIRQLIELPSNSPYLTLSYVWGSAHAFEGIDESIQNAPRVINDALHVVRSLGFRYLWIDRYCIPQGDPEEKHRLIQNMGSIYKGSALTLIAAAGDGPHYGLPGISPGLRRAHSTISIGPWALVPQETGLVRELNESKWNSRGWTYQEAILSHRKLVFTSSQTYFQCQAMQCLESISLSLEKLHTSNLQQELGTRIPRLFPSQGLGKTSVEIINRVYEFTRRELSYDNDVLDAFRGVLREFEARIPSVNDLYGVIIFNPECLVGQGTTNTDRFVHGLMWIANGQAERRVGFPSWTWAGWKSKWPELRLLGGPFDGKYHTNGWKSCVDIAVEFAHGALIDWEENQSTILERCAVENLPPLLQVRALTFDIEWTISAHYFIPWSPIYFRAVGCAQELTATLRGVHIEPQLILRSSCKAIIMLRSDISPAMLLVRKLEDKPHFERFGIMQDLSIVGKKVQLNGESEIVAVTNARVEEIVLG